MSRRLPILVLVAAAVAGCGSNSHPSTRGVAPPGTATTPSTTTAALPPTTITAFRVHDGKLAAESEQVPHTQAVAAASLHALGIEASVQVTDGTARVDLSGASEEQVAEIVYTLTQFSSVERVDVGGRTGLARGDVAAFVPPILVESPGSGASVPAVFTVSGTASVFEATLVVELRRGGRVLTKQTVTATVGAPGRGTFSTTLHAPSPGDATIAAYAPSAADGTPQHEQDVAVTVGP
ncbi:MAG: Gmad2 immunoglobulin-like domain-containing protein [Gaiellaceae bacterium]